MAVAAVESIGVDEGAATLPDDARNLDETARFFDRSLPTVRGWIADGCPVIRGGSNGVPYVLSLRAVKAWLDGIERAERQEADRKAASDAQLRLELLGGTSLAEGVAGAISAKAKHDTIQAELAAMKLGRERGELVMADELAISLAETFGKVRDQVRGIPDQLARAVGLSEQQLVPAIDAVDAILSDMADQVAVLCGAH